MTSRPTAIETYIRAKDGNRPHLMAAAFADDAVLNMEVRTNAIAFPPRTIGLSAIADILVRRFGQTFENVYTLCLSEPSTREGNEFACDWVVGMSEKASGDVRVGCGTYRWRITRDTGTIKALTIAIDEMVVLPPYTLPHVIDWLAALPYPSCGLQDLLAHSPRIEALQPVLTRLGSAQARGSVHTAS